MHFAHIPYLLGNYRDIKSSLLANWLTLFSNYFTERLTDNLRAMTDLNVPILTQMFLCTRVLVARISSESLASLWLLVIPELVSYSLKIVISLLIANKLLSDSCHLNTSYWLLMSFTTNKMERRQNGQRNVRFVGYYLKNLRVKDDIKRIRAKNAGVWEQWIINLERG